MDADFSFYQELFSRYMDIDIPTEYEDISRIDKYINWYAADNNKSFITTKYNKNQVIVNIDIKQAFPTIANLLYKNDIEFINKINNKDLSKRERLIIIATEKKKDLLEFNRICKMIVFGYLFDNHIDDIIILEIKKDGLLAIVSNDDYNRLSNSNDYGGNFSKFILNNKFIIKNDIYKFYLRSNKTSWYINNNILDIKGEYNKIPKYLKEISYSILFNKKYDINKLKQIYSYDYFNIINKSGCLDLLQDYYLSLDKYNKLLILNPDGKYINYNRDLEINPFIYLQIFIFPLILAMKIK